jgi:hypothetical protein
MDYLNSLDVNKSKQHSPKEKQKRPREDSYGKIVNQSQVPNIKAELEFKQQTTQSFANNQPKAPKHKREHSAKPFTGPRVDDMSNTVQIQNYNASNKYQSREPAH